MFTKARLKLTGSYILLLVIIITVFSLFLSHYTVQHIQDSVEENATTMEAQQRLADRAVDSFQNTLITSDVIVVILASLLAYLLAGRTLKPIKKAHDAQMQFSAHASHELRTPLSVMKTENEVFLRRSDVEAPIKELVQSNLEEINRMTKIVEDLLLLARSSNAKHSISFEKLDLNTLLSRITKKQDRFADAKNLHLVLNFSDQVFVLGNERLLEQLFTNIIQNAIAYTDKGVIAVRVKESEKATVEIEDTGSGIAAKDISRITEPFYKADASRHSSGVGLGLAIAREIVELHKGTLFIESKAGKGTTVSVTLPSFEKGTM